MTSFHSNEAFLDQQKIEDPDTRGLLLERMARYGDDHWWELETPEREFAYRQLYEPMMISAFDRFHAALETLLGRPVYTHELGINYAAICEEADQAWETGETRDPVQAEAKAIADLIEYADKNGKKVIIITGGDK